ncbi:putative Bifunctional protein glmU [Megalodesulfovibrio gigas DSM 1382 = ATCC 19364]|uniref:Bifunctional protein GlmU n=1 Tax=Megalodesulfovibrio gigas (strain ATCC 19364 / DSM 1382 / NCIMB 9332 / VKM B-1759) TaxID=1121448 RepID=T2G8S3_MEGG1|nr:putative Bifunctional protein glmU [Megalodesulfovibrio gigas DSM 1382 = ATCC 19364]
MTAALPNSVGGLVLAAGKGTRMHSAKPKVLHELLDEPMLWHVHQALEPLLAHRFWTVLGFGADQVCKRLPEVTARCVLQHEQLGTGHALQCAWETLRAASLTHVLVVNGDTPLVPPQALSKMVHVALEEKAAVAFLSITLNDPRSFGRVVRSCNGDVAAIVEAKDYDRTRFGYPTGEINAGIYLLQLDAVGPLLGQLGNNNRSGEYYITDLVGLAKAAGHVVLAENVSAEGMDPEDAILYLGINAPAELVAAEEHMRRCIVTRWAAENVLIRSPDLVRIGPRVQLTPGAEIHGPCELYGQTTLARGALVMSHCWVKDATLESDTTLHPFSHVERAHLHSGAAAGPFARLRPGAVLEQGSRVGNFVEMKKARLGRNAKAGHLTYLGDAEIGPDTNIGAGTITCNYDGARKHLTKIGENVFIGSNTALVAPVHVGDRALVAAGSVITDDVPADALALARGRQVLKSKKPAS